MNGATIKCKHCNKDFYVSRCHVNNRYGKGYCSKQCHVLHQGLNKNTWVCKICHKEFKWSASRGKGKYCSIDCRNKCPEWKLNAVIAGNIKQQNNKGYTKLELKGYNILDGLGIDYRKQAIINGKFTVDVLVEDKKLVIQWDGDYWHGWSGLGKTLDNRQLKRMSLDKSQDAYLIACGYTVIRFWEHEVNGSPQLVVDKIKHYVEGLKMAEVEGEPIKTLFDVL